MFARLTIMHIDIEKIDDAIKVYKKSVVPAAREQKGFRGAYLLADRKTGKGISLTLWRNEEDALANEKNRYYQEQLVKFVPFFISAPIREGYEVSLREE